MPLDDAQVRELWPRIYTLSYRMLGNVPDAQDAAQETFARALDHWEAWLGEGPRERWILRIATRACLDRLEERRKSRMRQSATDPETLPSRPPEPSPQAVLDRIRECLEDLPLQQRAAFVLRDMEGLPPEGVAEALGCSPSTVRVHLMRARLGIRASWIRRFGKRP